MYDPEPSAGVMLQTQCSRRALLSAVARTILLVTATPYVAACAVQTDTVHFAVHIAGPEPTWFDPASLTIPRGALVTWKNDDRYVHSVVCDPTLAAQLGVTALLPQGAPLWHSGDLYPGETWSYTFNVPGQYIYCSGRNHGPSTVGSIIVTG